MGWHMKSLERMKIHQTNCDNGAFSLRILILVINVKTSTSHITWEEEEEEKKDVKHCYASVYNLQKVD